MHGAAVFDDFTSISDGDVGECTELDFGGEMHPRPFSQGSPCGVQLSDRSRLHGTGRLSAEVRCEVLFEAPAARGSSDRSLVSGSALTASHDRKAVGPEKPN